jgi:hypothetical protein
MVHFFFWGEWFQRTSMLSVLNLKQSVMVTKREVLPRRKITVTGVHMTEILVLRVLGELNNMMIEHLNIWATG